MPKLFKTPTESDAISYLNRLNGCVFFDDDEIDEIISELCEMKKSNNEIREESRESKQIEQENKKTNSNVTDVPKYVTTILI